MKKKIFYNILLICLAFITNNSSAQFTPFKSGQYLHLAADTLYNLTGCGVPSFHPLSYKRVVTYFDSCSGIPYWHNPKTNTWITAGTESGSVTSVGANGSNGITVTGSPITSSGTFGIGFDTSILGLHTESYYNTKYVNGTAPGNFGNAIINRNNVYTTPGGDTLSLNSGTFGIKGNLTASGRFAVGVGVQSEDFFNNGTSRFMGAARFDGTLTFAGNGTPGTGKVPTGTNSGGDWTWQTPAGSATLDTLEITPNIYAGLGYSDTKKIQLALNLAVSLRRQLVIGWNNERAANLWMIDSAVLLSSNSNILIRNSKLKLTDSSRDNIFRTGNCGIGITTPASNPMVNISIIGQGSAVLEGADNPRSSGGWTKNLGTHVDIYQVSQLNTYGTDSGKAGRTQVGDWRNHGVIIAYTTNVKVQGISLMYLHCYGLEFERCRDVIVKDIPFFMPGYPATGDTTKLMRNMGPIDFALSANNVLVDNVHGWSEDDNLAFNVTNISNAAGSVGNLYPIGDTSNSARDSITNIVVTNVDGGSFSNIIRFLNPGNSVITRGVTINNLIGRPNTTRTYSDAYGFTRVRAITMGSSSPPYAGVNPLGQVSRFNINNIIIDSAKYVIDLVTSLSNSNISGLKKNSTTYYDFPLINNICDTCVSHWDNITGANGAYTIERSDNIYLGQATLTLQNKQLLGTAASRLRLLRDYDNVGSGFFRGSNFYSVTSAMVLADYENKPFQLLLGTGSGSAEKFSLTADGATSKFTTASATMRLQLNSTHSGKNVGIMFASSGTAVWQIFTSNANGGLSIFNQGLGANAFTVETSSSNIYMPQKMAIGYTSAQNTYNLDVAGTGRFTGAVTTAGRISAYTSTATGITLGATNETVEITATGQTITLPTAVGATGRVYRIKLTASGSGTVATTSSQTIDGSTTYSLSAQYKYVTVQSNGSNWLIIANN